MDVAVVWLQLHTQARQEEGALPDTAQTARLYSVAGQKGLLQRQNG